MVVNEQRAIKIVMKYEKKQGRNPKDVHAEGLGYDVKSGKRLIEVKGKGSSKPKFTAGITLYKTLLKKLGKNILNYYIYIVYGLDENKPKMKILTYDLIFKNLEIDTRYLIRGKVIRDKGLKEIIL